MSERNVWVNLNHPCQEVDVWYIGENGEQPEDVIADEHTARGQGYVPLAELRGLAQECEGWKGEYAKLQAMLAERDHDHADALMWRMLVAGVASAMRRTAGDVQAVSINVVRGGQFYQIGGWPREYTEAISAAVDAAVDSGGDTPPPTSIDWGVKAWQLACDALAFLEETEWLLSRPGEDRTLPWTHARDALREKAHAVLHVAPGEKGGAA